MVFNSYIFILAFLPITLFVYFGLCKLGNRIFCKTWLLVMSLVFYGYFNFKYLAIIIASVMINYFFSYLIKNGRSKGYAKPILILAIILNLGSIFYFKYYDFFIENINVVLKTSFTLKHLLLPLGISFFTFQQLSYLIDTYKGEIVECTLLDYALYITFFPPLIAGPIVLNGEFLPQIKNEKTFRVNHENISYGIYLFSIGLFKKVIIADTVALAVEWGFAAGTLTQMDAIIVMLSYTFQIYFDFSGYCDMAAGIASMFNIKLPMNFNSPYKATSILEFWDRWHMTLTRFFRKYVYFPLGGSRKGSVRTYVNIMIIFLLSGLWHGANWTFILWGALHGIANALTRIFHKSWEKMHSAFRWFLTFSFVNVAWLIFRSDSIGFAVNFLKNMISLQNLSISNGLSSCFEFKEMQILAKVLHLSHLAEYMSNFYVWIFLFLAGFIVLNFKNCYEQKFAPTKSKAFISVFLLSWCILSLSGITTFIYFNF